MQPFIKHIYHSIVMFLLKATLNAYMPVTNIVSQDFTNANTYSLINGQTITEKSIYGKSSTLQGQLLGNQYIVQLKVVPDINANNVIFSQINDAQISYLRVLTDFEFSGRFHYAFAGSIQRSVFQNVIFDVNVRMSSSFDATPIGSYSLLSVVGSPTASTFSNVQINVQYSGKVEGKMYDNVSFSVFGDSGQSFFFDCEFMVNIQMLNSVKVSADDFVYLMKKNENLQLSNTKITFHLGSRQKNLHGLFLSLKNSKFNNLIILMNKTTTSGSAVPEDWQNSEIALESNSNFFQNMNITLLFSLGVTQSSTLYVYGIKDEKQSTLVNVSVSSQIYVNVVEILMFCPLFFTSVDTQIINLSLNVNFSSDHANPFDTASTLSALAFDAKNMSLFRFLGIVYVDLSSETIDMWESSGFLIESLSSSRLEVVDYLFKGNIVHEQLRAGFMIGKMKDSSLLFGNIRVEIVGTAQTLYPDQISVLSIVATVEGSTVGSSHFQFQIAYSNPKQDGEVQMGALGGVKNSKIENVSANVSGEITTYELSFGALALSVDSNSSVSRCFSFGLLIFAVSAWSSIAGLIVQLAAKLESSYSHIDLVTTSAQADCYLGVAASSGSLREVLQQEFNCNGQTRCYPTTTIHNSFSFCDDLTQIGSCVDGSKTPNDVCVAVCIQPSQLKNETVFKQLFRNTSWGIDPSINQGFPHLLQMQNFLSQVILWNQQSNSKDEQLHPPTGINEIKDGRNMCINLCHGMQTSILTPLICQQNYLLSMFCFKLDCNVADLCKGPNNLCSSGACICKDDQKGQLCEQSICTDCSKSYPTCTVIGGAVYSCDASQFCIDGNCSNCEDGFKGGTCTIPECTNCNNQGTCTAGLCICNVDSTIISYNNNCFSKIFPDRGECFMFKSQLMCTSCSSSFQGSKCDQCLNGFIFSENQCVEGCTSSNNKCQNGGTCTNTRCECINNYVAPFCQCLNGQILENSVCKDKCTPQTCVNGHCENESSCVCTVNSGYHGPSCEDFNCNLLPEPKCSGRGSCLLYSCVCENNFDGVTCQQCQSGFMLNNSLCYPLCIASQCKYGQCSNTHFCQCQVGYEGMFCDTYKCLSDPNPCNGEGDCVNGICTCNSTAKKVDGNCFSLDCNGFINGVCDEYGGSCFNGWGGANCSKYDCSLDTVSPCNNLGSCNSIDGSCYCSSTSFNNTCLVSCTSLTIIVLLQPMNQQPGFSIGGVFQLNNSIYSIKSLCTIAHLGCQCFGSLCSCNQNVAYLDFLGDKVLFGCVAGAKGLDCNDCQDGFTRIKNQCYLNCEMCNGKCYYNDQSKIFCISCNQGNAGDDCSLCDQTSIPIQGVCYQRCYEFNGECYRHNINSTCICVSCVLDNFDINSLCKNCASDFENIYGLCMKKCTTCGQGKCFIDASGVTFCLDCNNNLQGGSCDRCLTDYVYYAEQCSVQLNNTNGSCAKFGDEIICVDCNVGFINDANQCFIKCVSEQCQSGTCYLRYDDYYCLDCENSYYQYIDKCYQITYESLNGFCIIYNKNELCFCIEPYTGSRCSQCDTNTLAVGEMCLKKCLHCHGDCFEMVNSTIICNVCDQGYAFPDCQVCSEQYRMIDGICSGCQPPAQPVDQIESFPSKPLSGCLILCNDSLQGICYSDRERLYCHTCKEGYNEPDCQLCSLGFFKAGDYCLKEIELFHYEFEKEKVCTACDETLFGITCSNCVSSAIMHNDQCHSIIMGYYGNYLEDDQIMIFDDTDFLCKVGQMRDLIFCEQCNDNLVSINGTCYHNLSVTKTSKASKLLKGNCYQVIYDHQVFCIDCFQNFAGDLCSQCQDGFILYEQQCRQRMSGDNGFCFFDDGKKVCLSCGKGYKNLDGDCVKQNRVLAWGWALIVLFVLIVISIITVLIYFNKLKKKSVAQYQIYKLKAIQIIQNIIARTGLVLLAQIIAVAASFQDMLSNSFDGFMLSVFFQSVIIFALFMFFGKFNHTYYIFLDKYDAIVFFFYFGMEVLFQVVLYYIMPSVLANSEQMFKALTAPIALMIFIMALGFKFTLVQKYAITFCISLALIPLLFETIRGSVLDTYFFDEISVVSLGLIPLSILLSASTLIVNIVLASKVLRDYTEIETMCRSSIFQFLISGGFVLYRLYNHINIFLQEQILVQTALYVAIQGLSLFVMKHLTSLEMLLNLATSALWVQVVSEVISLQKANAFGSLGQVVSAVLAVLGLIAIIAAVIIFYYYRNYFMAVQNVRRGMEEKLEKEHRREVEEAKRAFLKVAKENSTFFQQSVLVKRQSQKSMLVSRSRIFDGSQQLQSSQLRQPNMNNNIELSFEGKDDIVI